MRSFLPVTLAALAALMGACSSSSSHSSNPPDAGGEGGVDASPETGEAGGPKIEHVVVIIQENHTFDSYFANWCTAATGSNPTCTQGPSCCEAGPAKDPGSSTVPSTLNDAFNAARDPNHTQACEVSEIDNGKMDGFVTSTVSGCGSAQNFAYADATTVQTYWTMAQQGALADRYFQPVAGQSESNDMYLARARYVFLDNTYEPQAIGSSCSTNGDVTQYTDTTLGDLLDQASVPWTWYSEGYAAMAAAVKNGTCPAPPSDCSFANTIYPCVFDPSDDPFEYYKDLVDDPAHIKDYSALATDLAAGTLPAVVFVKALGYKTEHPGYGDTVSAGTTFVSDAVAAIQGSSAASSTLVLITWDEGGGFFDHVAPPPTSTVDNQPYGTRLPLLAVGPLARTGTISHTTMEHSSIVKFIEYNWLGGQTGQLQGRDATVADIGSLLVTASGIPEN
jgi:phospholipase C